MIALTSPRAHARGTRPNPGTVMPTSLLSAPGRRALSAAAMVLALACGPAVAPAHAQVEVDINQGQLNPLPIAIAPFTGPQGADIAGVISADLQRSGYFQALNAST